MTKRLPPRPWKPGQSGNPKGRPTGVGEVARLRAAIAKDMPEIIKALVVRAKQGDGAAARVLVDRVLPPIKATEEAAPIKLPEGALTDQGKAVLRAIAEGSIAPGQGAAVLASLGALAKLTETDELTRRIEALEKKHDTAAQG